MAVRQNNFDIFADYFQFYLQDEEADGDLSDGWTPEAIDRMLAVAPNTLGIGTVRNMTVPVEVRVLDAAPEDSLDGWDQVVDCSVGVPSGRIVIAGCTDFFPHAARIEVSPGVYRARVFYGNLDSLSDDGLKGDDRYSISLWNGVPIEPVTLKARLTGRGR